MSYSEYDAKIDDGDDYDDVKRCESMRLYDDVRRGQYDETKRWNEENRYDSRMVAQLPDPGYAARDGHLPALVFGARWITKSIMHTVLFNPQTIEPFEYVMEVRHVYQGGAVVSVAVSDISIRELTSKLLAGVSWHSLGMKSALRIFSSSMSNTESAGSNAQSELRTFSSSVMNTESDGTLEKIAVFGSTVVRLQHPQCSASVCVQHGFVAVSTQHGFVAIPTEQF